MHYPNMDSHTFIVDKTFSKPSIHVFMQGILNVVFNNHLSEIKPLMYQYKYFFAEVQVRQKADNIILFYNYKW